MGKLKVPEGGKVESLITRHYCGGTLRKGEILVRVLCPKMKHGMWFHSETTKWFHRLKQTEIKILQEI